MERILKALKSRTTWTIVAMFVIGGVDAITQFIPAGLLTPIQGFLGVLAIYFKVTPSQKY